MIYKKKAVIAVTPVTVVTDDPTDFRGSGLTSTGFVATNPLVRESPETPGGDDLA